MEKKLEKALEIIEDLDWETVECGTYTVDDDIFIWFKNMKQSIHKKLVTKLMRNMWIFSTLSKVRNAWNLQMPQS